MRPPSILDVVRAVKAVSPEHDDVDGWWYAPAKRLRLGGERPVRREVPVEIALEGEVESGDYGAIGAELSRELRGFPVRVRAYRGKHDDGHLFRLLSGDGGLRASG